MRFGILGPLRVAIDDHDVQVTSAKQRAVLAALILHANRAVTIPRLTEAVWGDTAPASARGLVHTYVWRIRQLLDLPAAAESRVAAAESGYRLRAGPGEVDAIEFERLAGQVESALARGDTAAARTALRAALALWRGEPAEGVRLHGGFEGDVWHLAERRIAVLEDRIEADLACGQHRALVAELRQLAAEHPLRERLAAQLMLALLRCARQADALAEYERIRSRLAEDLGLDPGVELRRLHQAVLRGDPALMLAASSRAGVAPERAAEAAGKPEPAADRGAGGVLADGGRARQGTTASPAAGAAVGHGIAVHQQPADLPDFVARKELARILAVAVAGRGRPPAVVTVVGPGGVGKTVLAVRAANRLRERFPGGELFVNLRGLTGAPLAPLEVIGRFLRAMGVAAEDIPAGFDEAGALYRSVLADRAVLLLFDDAANEAQIRSLLPTGAGSLAIVTSRNHLAGLCGAVTIALEVFTPLQAATLTRRIVGPGRVAGEPAALGELLAACGYLPLAVRITGARLAARPGWKIADLVSRLRDERRRLDYLAAGDLEVRATVALSHRALTQGDELVFRRLAWQPGLDFGPHTTAALVGGTSAGASLALERLADASLLQVARRGDRYRMHDLIRAYAAEVADQEEQAGEHAAALRRLLIWYLHTVRSADSHVAPERAHRPFERPDPLLPPLPFGSHAQALAWLDAERPALVEAVRQAGAHGMHDLAWRLANALVTYFDTRSHWADWIATHEIGLASAEAAGDRYGESVMRNALGTAHLGVGQYERSLDYHEQALAMRRVDGTPQSVAAALSNLGLVLRELGQLRRAQRCHQEAMRLRRGINDRYGEGVSLNNLATLHADRGNHGQALTLYEQALAIWRDTGNRKPEGITLTHIGEVLAAMGRDGDAAERLEQAVAAHRDVGNRHHEQQALDLLAALGGGRGRGSSVPTATGRSTKS